MRASLGALCALLVAAGAAPAPAQRGFTGRTPVPPTEELLAGRAGEEWERSPELRERVRAAGLGEPFARLLASLAALAESADPSRLPLVSLGFREPFALPGLVEDAAEGFEAAGAALPDARAALAGALEQARRALHLPPPVPADLAPLPHGVAPGAHLDAVEARLVAAGAAVERAFAGLDEKERFHLGARWGRIGERFEEHIYVHDDPHEQRRGDNLYTIALAERVERGALLDAAQHLAELADPTWLAGLVTDLEASGLDLARPIVLERPTPLGRIVIAGRGDDVHRLGAQGSGEGPGELIAVLIELGGDDVYATASGSTTNQRSVPVLPASLLIDLAGDDAYEATHAGAQGAGILGVGLLLDLAGDDSYVGLRWAQGAAFCGVGALVDLAGNDVYRAHAFAQGAAAWGVGILIDGEGDDRYEAHLGAQGLGMPGALGLLVDLAGDDRYYCKGTRPSSYGTAGVFEGWGQGCGVGLRLNASGGFGLLLDGGGDDRYEAGNFAQGGGYFFALGALIDRGAGADLYIGSRYNQGFAAHQALGYFRDGGGDDVYRTRNAVHAGLAWDQCVVFFVEDGGDDEYQGGGFSTGASAHGSLCVFWERGGRDVIHRGEPARAGPNDYHGTPSLSFFLSEGGAQDRYPGPARNDTERVNAEHGIFIDR